MIDIRKKKEKKISDFVHPKTLPPTPEGGGGVMCKYSERVYLSIQEWRVNQLNLASSLGLGTSRLALPTSAY